MSVAEKRALELWREREMKLPERVRRMNPDALDIASGAWHACLFKAVSEQYAAKAVKRATTEEGPQ